MLEYWSIGVMDELEWGAVIPNPLRALCGEGSPDQGPGGGGMACQAISGATCQVAPSKPRAEGNFSPDAPPPCVARDGVPRVLRDAISQAAPRELSRPENPPLRPSIRHCLSDRLCSIDHFPPPENFLCRNPACR